MLVRYHTGLQIYLKKRNKPAAVVVVAIGDRLCGNSQVIKVIHVRTALQKQLDYMSVSPASRHGQDACSKPVAPINLCPVLQKNVGDSQVAKPGRRNRTEEELCM